MSQIAFPPPSISIAIYVHLFNYIFNYVSLKHHPCYKSPCKYFTLPNSLTLFPLSPTMFGPVFTVSHLTYVGLPSVYVVAKCGQLPHLTSAYNSSIKGGKGGLKLRFVSIERKSRRISLPPNRRRNEGNLERANPRISGALAAAAATKEGCLGIAGQLVMGWRELCLNVIIWR